MSFRTHARVVHALVLRDIKTRTGASYFGFLLGLILPLGHIGVVLGIYLVVGRRPPIGTDTLLFLTSAILPFIVWSYTHQRMMAAFSQNQALTSFPIVGLLEIAIARAIVELLSSIMIAAVTLTVIWIAGTDMFFNDPKMLLFCFLLSYLSGVGTGLVFGTLSVLNYFIAMLGYLLIPLFWILSGALFIPDALPVFARNALSIFAITHVVDITRMAIYPQYISDFPSIIFVLISIGVNTLCFLLMTHFMKNFLRSA